jgi:hypothetical protein
MMKALLLCGLSILGSACFASGLPCEKIEYAQLKDSTKNELDSLYCNSERKAEYNRFAVETSRTLFRQKMESGVNGTPVRLEAEQLGNAQVACVRVAESIAAMQQKQFQAAPPRCPK